MAQRLDILIDLPRAGAFPILAQLEGAGRQTGIVFASAGAQIPRIADNVQAAPPLDNSLETRSRRSRCQHAPRILSGQSI
jgi:hypothetical protein